MVPELVSVLLATDADWLYDDVDAALADESTTVHRVRSGRVVVPTVREIDPQLVVLDLQIGNVGGVATALALRQGRTWAGSPGGRS
jgi:DNA-binding response OmpR family regulator